MASTDHSDNHHDTTGKTDGAAALNDAVNRILGSDWSGKSLDQILDEKIHADMGKMPRVNILLFGQPGVGKSTLVNSILRKKLAPVRVGRSITLTITEYSDDSIPIRIFDTRGVELGDGSHAMHRRSRRRPGPGIPERHSRPQHAGGRHARVPHSR